MGCIDVFFPLTQTQFAKSYENKSLRWEDVQRESIRHPEYVALRNSKASSVLIETNITDEEIWVEGEGSTEP